MYKTGLSVRLLKRWRGFSKCWNEKNNGTPAYFCLWCWLCILSKANLNPTLEMSLLMANLHQAPFHQLVFSGNQMGCAASFIKNNCNKQQISHEQETGGKRKYNVLVIHVNSFQPSVLCLLFHFCRLFFDVMDAEPSHHSGDSRGTALEGFSIPNRAE